MKLYYCTDCKRYYWPGPNGTSEDFLSREESLAVVLAGQDSTSIRCDACMDKAVEKMREARKGQNQRRREVENARE